MQRYLALRIDQLQAELAQLDTRLAIVERQERTLAAEHATITQHYQMLQITLRTLRELGPLFDQQSAETQATQRIRYPIHADSSPQIPTVSASGKVD